MPQLNNVRDINKQEKKKRFLQIFISASKKQIRDFFE